MQSVLFLKMNSYVCIFFYFKNFYLVEKQNKENFVKLFGRFVVSEFVKTCDELILHSGWRNFPCKKSRLWWTGALYKTRRRTTWNWGDSNHILGTLYLWFLVWQIGKCSRYVCKVHWATKLLPNKKIESNMPKPK